MSQSEWDLIFAPTIKFGSLHQHLWSLMLYSCGQVTRGFEIPDRWSPHLSPHALQPHWLTEFNRQIGGPGWELVQLLKTLLTETGKGLVDCLGINNR